MTSGIFGRALSLFTHNQNRPSRSLLLRLSAFVLLSLAGGKAWAQQVVISQIYGGSNATGATYNRDYVELHNRGSNAVSLAGWSLQVATSTGSTWTRSNIVSGSIAPGGYFLVQMTTSGTIGVAIPTPDATSPVQNDIATGSGKVALVTNQTTLPAGGAFQLGSNGIADFVGFGQTSATVGPNGYEGTGGTPGAGTVALAIYRINGGCTDTHNNAIDFGAPALPLARNSASAPFNCTATGACCNGTLCSYVDAGSCGGNYQGDFSLCGVVSYPAPASPVNAFDDISGTGTLQATLNNSDDGQVTIPLSLAFNYFGNARSQISVGANGLVTFLPGTTATSFSNVAIPAVGTPNDMIAPLWMDLFVRTTQIPAAHVYTQQKAAPNRFIVQWNQVSTRSSSTTTPDNLTFELILNQDTGEVEFRYATMTTTGTTPAYAASTGLEDQSGTLGSSFAGGSFAALANTARLFTPGGQSTCSPPVNDNCAGASTIPGVGTGPGGVSGLNTLATLDGAATACGVPCDKDVWFSFQPGFTNNWVISTCPNATQDTVIEVYDACGGNLVACDDDGCGLQSTLTVPLVSSNTYRIRVAAKGAGAAGGAYTLTVVQQAPANDLCAGAVVIGSTPFVSAATDGNGPAATDDLDTTCNSGTTTNRGVWFTITPAVSGNLTWSETSTNDTSVAIFTGGCGGLTQVSCSDPESAFFGVTAGTQYWILVGMFSATTVPTVGYGLSVDVIPPLANDTCAGAIALAIPSVTAGTTVTATTETPAPPACVGPLPGGSQSFALGTSVGVWYSVISPINQTLTADTMASAYDSRLWIYDASGGCNALVCVTANDDAVGSPFQSRAAWHAVAGVPYYILVAPFSTTLGSFTLTISGDPTPANDDCAGATILSGVSGSVGGTTIGSTALTNTSTAANPSCSTTSTYSMFDVWYEWTAPCSGNLTVNTCGSYDTWLSVHTGCSTPTTSNQVTGACNDSGGTGCTPGSSLIVAVTGGVTYKFRVAAGLNTVPMNNFTLSWSLPDADADGVADSCDGCPLDPAKIAPGACGCGVADTDTDGDLVADCVDGCPLDPAKVAPGQCGCGVADTDGDGDGTADCNDGCPTDPSKIAPGICGCGVSDADTDGDGTPNCNDGCPSDPNKTAPGTCGCGVSDADTDGDGIVDCNDGCPTDPNKTSPGVCGCGVSDADGDGDGTLDCNDGCPADPNKITPGICGCGVPDTDSDGDATADCNDGCPTDPLKVVPGACGCGTPDTDSDGDATPDCNDGCPTDPLKVVPGACGCGTPDTDTDGDATADCNDGCPTDPNKTAPGLCGCGVADTDSDSDGVGDCTDNCPTIANLNQLDMDADLVGDVCDNCVAVTNPSQADCDLDGIGDACAILVGAPDCNNNGVPDSCDIGGGGSTDGNLNGIPDECELNGGTPYCFGDGSGNGGPDCPCSNNTPIGAQSGCANSLGIGGRMYGSGQTSVSNDQLVLTMTNLPPNVSCILAQGNTPQAGGFGSTLYDGLLCINTNLKRLALRNSGPSGLVTIPSGVDPDISVMGGVPVGGARRYYQLVYRNTTGPCGFGANATNGVSIVWTP